MNARTTNTYLEVNEGDDTRSSAHAERSIGRSIDRSINAIHKIFIHLFFFFSYICRKIQTKRNHIKIKIHLITLTGVRCVPNARMQCTKYAIIINVFGLWIDLYVRKLYFNCM